MEVLYNNTVLLFFKDFERDSFFSGDRHIKRMLRPIYYKFKKGQKTSGFAVWYRLLVKALEQEGYDVHLNNYALAYHNPHYPIGLVGYPHLLDGWALPNPAVLGPALYDHPQLAPRLMEDLRYKKFIVTCQWMYDIFEPTYKDKCGLWYAGIDTANWRDTRYHSKTNDILIYDKIRWNRDHYEPNLLEPIKKELESRNLSYELIRYKFYDHESYRKALSRSRAMIFLCEHETQGMAYQEALASNVPILAWDQGWWLDVNRPKYSPDPIRATSVPYWSADCGEKFRNVREFVPVFDQFWQKLEHYEPRQFVENTLSFKGSAEQYIAHYTAAAYEAQINSPKA